MAELAEAIDARVVGDADARIERIATLADAGPGAITFLHSVKYRPYLKTTGASAVILREADLDLAPCSALVCDNPYLAYAHLSALFAPARPTAGAIHPSAVVAGDASLDPSVVIGPLVVIESGAVIGRDVVIAAGCVIGSGSRIGAGSLLYPNVTLYHGVTLGERVTIHSGTVLGSDGFGFANQQGRWVKIHQLGGVVIGDGVEIGANTTVDRGALEDTVIEEGAILDNQIQVAHNVHIGRHTAIAGCVGIAGSARIGAHCAIGGGAGILGHLDIVDGVTVTATSLVTKSIRQPGVYSSGTPLEPSVSWQKNFARFKQLDEMARRIRALEKQLKSLTTED